MNEQLKEIKSIIESPDLSAEGMVAEIGEKLNQWEGAETVRPHLRPSLAFYHPNPRGTGCATKLALYPAVNENGKELDGYMLLTLSPQMTVGNPMGPNPTFPRFDWEHSLSVKLGFNDIAMFLQVLRGECEEINGDKGLFKRTQDGCYRITFRHIIDPVSGYALDIYKTPAGGGEEQRVRCLLSPAESLGVCEALSTTIWLVAFGEK